MNKQARTLLIVSLTIGFIIIIIYNRRKNKPSNVAKRVYNDMDDSFKKVENISEAMFA